MIPVFQPLLEKEEYEACKKVLDVGWLGQGADVGRFEKKISAFINIPDKHVVAFSTGHAALHLGMLSVGIGPGDEVITPAFNNIADFQAIKATGASIVFCDIDDRTLTIDPEKAEEMISEKTKAIIAMDYQGLLCDYEKINDLAKKYNLRVLHDAAHSFGSKYKGRMIGSFSDMCMFSFDPVKIITCLDGGVLIVNSEEQANKLRDMRLVGMGQSHEIMYQNKRSWTYDVTNLGFRNHMSNMHAAIGCAQISKMDKITKSRFESCTRYSEGLKNIEGIIIPNTDWKDICPFLYYIRVKNKKREELIKYLASNGVDVGIHWHPGHWFSLFKDCKKGDLSICDQVGHEILSLPTHSMMPIETVDKVILEIRNFFAS